MKKEGWRVILGGKGKSENKGAENGGGGNTPAEPKDYIRLVREAMNDKEPNRRLEFAAADLGIYVKQHNAPNHSKLLVDVVHHLAKNLKYRTDTTWMSVIDAYPQLKDEPYKQKAIEAWETEYKKRLSDEDGNTSKANIIIVTQLTLAANGIPRNDPFFEKTDKSWEALPDDVKLPYLKRKLRVDGKHFGVSDSSAAIDADTKAHISLSSKLSEAGLSAEQLDSFLPEFAKWSRPGLLDKILHRNDTDTPKGR